jgi:hypothetical protein
MIFGRFQPRQFLTFGYILVYCSLMLLYYNNMHDPYMYSKNDKERQGNYSRQWTGPAQAWAKWGLMRRREPPGDKGSP